MWKTERKESSNANWALSRPMLLFLQYIDQFNQQFPKWISFLDILLWLLFAIDSIGERVFIGLFFYPFFRHQ
jgi:hypothetical protein